MQRVLIIGCPGSGKTTFSKKLCEITGLPLYHLDAIWHRLDKTTLSKEEFDEKLIELLNRDRWILDGNYSRTLGLRLKYCDTVFLLDFPVEVCLSGAKSRVGKKRDDLPWTEDTLNEEFQKHIINFSEEKLSKIYDAINAYEGEKQIVIFRDREEINNYLEKIRKDYHEIRNYKPTIYSFETWYEPR